MIRTYLKIVAGFVVIVFALIGISFVGVYVAVKYGLTNTKGVIDEQRSSFLANVGSTPTTTSTGTLYWQTLPEWTVIKQAVTKDAGVINRAGASAGVNPRLIVANLVVEQLRLFYSERESYKKFFEPLKILGSQTQFSWGVMGMKKETALVVEENLKNTTSPFYLGTQYEHLLDFKTTDKEQERFIRMTDQHDHYGSYLYAGLFIHQIIHQWSQAGFDISKRPEIIATLYNIGFQGSRPNSDPKSGGALITLGERSYSFGELASEFYNSNELTDLFPR
jgi:hypothetical protein